MEIDLNDVCIEFCTRNYPLEAEPICALWQYDGTIYLQEDDDDDPTRIGTMLIYRLLPAVAHDAGVSLLDALDYISEDTAQYIALLDDEGAEFNEDVRKQYDDCICSSLLILDSVEIDQAYRGHGIGLLAARHAIELAENGALVACRPFPLQFAGYQGEEWKRDHPNLGQQDFEAALENYGAIVSAWVLASICPQTSGVYRLKCKCPPLTTSPSVDTPKQRGSLDALDIAIEAKRCSALQPHLGRVSTLTTRYRSCRYLHSGRPFITR